MTYGYPQFFFRNRLEGVGMLNADNQKTVFIEDFEGLPSMRMLIPQIVLHCDILSPNPSYLHKSNPDLPDTRIIGSGLSPTTREVHVSKYPHDMTSARQQLEVSEVSKCQAFERYCFPSLLCFCSLKRDPFCSFFL